MANKKTTKNKPTKSDPTGEVALFDEFGAPPISSEVSAIYDYVENKARSIGEHVRKNRGVPPGASPENMLSVEEKAIIILGRAVGIVWSEIKSRINQYRDEKGEPRITRPKYELGTNVITSHSDVVAAIQADVLGAVEAFSPLVSGQQRFIWRARIVELYRQEILRIWHMDPDHVVGRTAKGQPIYATNEWKDKMVAKLDRAMQPHFSYFDQIGESEDISALMVSPGDMMKQQGMVQKVQELEEMFEKGDISDEERINRLRELKHGDE